jgi:hypothetical protein
MFILLTTCDNSTRTRTARSMVGEQYRTIPSTFALFPSKLPMRPRENRATVDGQNHTAVKSGDCCDLINSETLVRRKLL